MPDTGAVFNGPSALGSCGRDRARGYRHLAIPTRNIEDIGRLAQPRDAAAQRANEPLAGRNSGSEMCGAPRKISMVKVVGLDPHRHKTSKQGLQNGRVVVDTAQQHSLGQEWNASAAEPGQ